MVLTNTDTCARTHVTTHTHACARPPPPPHTHTCCLPQQLTGCSASRAAEATEPLAVLPGPNDVSGIARGRVVVSAVVQLVSAVSR